ncbi:hypothetical protein LPJ57_009790, partial [Coemansia sp. RSA 486]
AESKPTALRCLLLAPCTRAVCIQERPGRISRMAVVPSDLDTRRSMYPSTRFCAVMPASCAGLTRPRSLLSRGSGRWMLAMKRLVSLCMLPRPCIRDHSSLASALRTSSMGCRSHLATRSGLQTSTWCWLTST